MHLNQRACYPQAFLIPYTGVFIGRTPVYGSRAGGGRTHMDIIRGILSPLRLPIPPPPLSG
jgi:hypothetical protein